MQQENAASLLQLSRRVEQHTRKISSGGRRPLWDQQLDPALVSVRGAGTDRAESG